MLLRLARLFRTPSSARRPVVLHRPLRFESLEARRVLSGTAIASAGEAEEATIVDVAPDFHLVDVNPNSATAGAEVSPRDYGGAVSVWYFTFFT